MQRHKCLVSGGYPASSHQRLGRPLPLVNDTFCSPMQPAMRALEGVAETAQFLERERVLRQLRRRVSELEAVLEVDDCEFARLHSAVL